MNGETFAGRGVIARSPHGRIDIMFGLVITTEAHPAFSGAKIHSNNTAEMSAMINLLPFLGRRGPVARDVELCIYYDSKHAAGVCLGTIQVRSHVQLALACQRSMLCAQPQRFHNDDKNARVMLGARIDPTPSPITMNALYCTNCFLHCGDRLRCNHAYQATCLIRHLPALPCQNVRLPKPKARYPHLPNVRSATRERSSDFRGWAICTDGATCNVNGEAFAGWRVIARTPRGTTDVMFGPVVTIETHPAFSGAKASSNNTAEMTAMIEALYFLGPRGSVARNEEAYIFYDSKHAAGVCLGTIQARSHMQLALACQRTTLYAQLYD